MPNSTTDRADRVIAECWQCQRLDPEALDAHRAEVHADIMRNRARIPDPLPAHVWPDGRPFT